jgi:hypothetical protein
MLGAVRIEAVEDLITLRPVYPFRVCRATSKLLILYFMVHPAVDKILPFLETVNAYPILFGKLRGK